ncbi:hypothetical protein ES705_10628 [subsurface metagenome]
MFGLSTLASSFTQGGGLGGMFGGGEESASEFTPISSGSEISGPVSFATGGMNITKTDSTPLLIFAGVAGLVLLIVLSRKKH